MSLEGRVCFGAVSVPTHPHQLAISVCLSLELDYEIPEGRKRCFIYCNISTVGISQVSVE